MLKTTPSLWSKTAKNTDRSTGPLARPFARPLAHFAHSLARGTVNDWMALLSVFFSIFDHSAPLFLVSWQTISRLIFVIEYVSGGDLMYHMQRQRRLPEDHARFYSAEIILALHHLHERGIIYRCAVTAGYLSRFVG